MKIKVLLLAFGCSMMSFGAYAQKGPISANNDNENPKNKKSR